MPTVDKDLGTVANIAPLQSPLRIIIADDHPLVREGIRAIAQQAGWTVVAEANDGREAVKCVKALKPDVAVLDISMPVMDGLEAARQIIKDSAAKVIILTMHETDHLVEEVLNAGASGFLLKSDTSVQLVDAVEAVRSNKTYFTSSVSEIVLEGYLNLNSKTEHPTSSSGRLTARQREIVELFAEGKTSRDVAGILGLSAKTVESHRVNIMRRLDCHHISDLVRYALRNHIIKSDKTHT